MTAPLIGLTTYGRDEKNRFTLFGEYVDGVRKAGGIAVLMPPGEQRLAEWLGTIDGLLFAGGGDLAATCYGGRETDSSYGIDAERDASELELMRLVLEGDLPTLCICRGMQILNTALGGSLIEHIPSEGSSETEHRRPPREPVRHDVEIQPGSRLAEVLGESEIAPYSWHHQAIRKLAPGLSVVACAPDGIIEAVEMPDRPWLLAVQWHPELSAADELVQQRLFDNLVEDASRRRQRK